MNELFANSVQIMFEAIVPAIYFVIRLVVAYMNAIWVLLFERYPFDDKFRSSMDEVEV